ncbi:MAG: hypothetical protein KA997_07505, partial [Moraxellaceae bacterium]|nr:hypothetical protein [Moraxellaceae bacterium]
IRTGTLSKGCSRRSSPGGGGGGKGNEEKDGSKARKPGGKGMMIFQSESDVILGASFLAALTGVRSVRPMMATGDGYYLQCPSIQSEG